MRQATAFAAAGLLLFIAMIVFGGAVPDHRAFALQATATLPSEIPPETKTLEVDKPLAESLNPDTAIHFYKFTGTTDQKVRISVDPAADSDFFMTITVMDQDLQTVLGGTIGEALVSGSVVIKLPADGLYIVSVEYGQATIGTPAPGTYDITLSIVK